MALERYLPNKCADAAMTGEPQRRRVGNVEVRTCDLGVTANAKPQIAGLGKLRSDDSHHMKPPLWAETCSSPHGPSAEFVFRHAIKKEGANNSPTAHQPHNRHPALDAGSMP